MRQVLAFLGALTLVACDGIGEPIVDRVSRRGTGGNICGQSDLSCQTHYVSQAPYPRPALAALPCPSGGALPQDCPVFAPFQSFCTLTMRGIEGLAIPLANQSCVQFDLSPEPGNRELEFTGLVARGDTMTLHADTPTTITFSGAQISMSRISVRGPITLEFTDQSVLDGVSIDSVDPVQVTLRESRIRGSSVLIPSGSLRALRTNVDDSKLIARDVTLEAVALSALQVTSERVVGIELQGETLQLDVGDASFSEIEITRLTLDRCGTALFVNARLSNPTLEPCTVGKLHTDSSAISRGRVRGEIESRDTGWLGVLIDTANTPSEFQLWGGSLRENMFCQSLQRLTVSQAITIACNDCMGVPDPPSRICSADNPDAGIPLPLDPFSFGDAGAPLEDGGTSGAEVNPACPVFEMQLPICDPLPEDRSPV